MLDVAPDRVTVHGEDAHLYTCSVSSLLAGSESLGVLLAQPEIADLFRLFINLLRSKREIALSLFEDDLSVLLIRYEDLFAYFRRKWKDETMDQRGRSSKLTSLTSVAVQSITPLSVSTRIRQPCDFVAS